MTSGNPNTGDLASEVPLISQRDEASNHNGGQILFGPDGYLYLSLGDEGASDDAYQNSQRIDRDFFSGILRLDVDQRAGSLAPPLHPSVHAGTYRIPPDNPFVGATQFNGTAITGRCAHGVLGGRPAQPVAVALRPRLGRALGRRRGPGRA